MRLQSKQSVLDEKNTLLDLQSLFVVWIDGVFFKKAMD